MTNAVSLLRATLAPHAAAVDGLIDECSVHALPLINNTTAHLLGAGGKRLRPLLALAFAAIGAEAVDKVPPEAIKIAASVELLHAATLLHDDVIDETHVRRGRPTVNALWSNKTGILVGDFLFACAFRHMTGAGHAGALRILSDAARDIVAGELLQLSVAGTVPEVATYFEIVRAKTSELFAAAAEAGAAVSGADAAACTAARNFGFAFGTVFQIIDDVLDYVGDEAVLGKPAGNDLREGKLTLPALLAYNKGDAAERLFWEEAARSGGDPTHGTALLKRHNAIVEAYAAAEEHALAAEAALSTFPASPVIDSLRAVVAASLVRRS